MTPLLMASLATACGSSETSSLNPASSSGDAGTNPERLSLAFASNCARCHGTTGTGQDPYPSLPGTLTLAEYTATVRAGRKLMPSFTTKQVSDADLASDYQWLKTKR